MLYPPAWPLWPPQVQTAPPTDGQRQLLRTCLKKLPNGLGSWRLKCFARPSTWTTGNDSSSAAPCNRASRDCRAPLPDSRHTPGAEWPTTVADGQDDWRLLKKPPQDRLEVNAHSTPQWNYTPEGVLASSPQVGLGGAGLGLRSSELYLKYICSKKLCLGSGYPIYETRRDGRCLSRAPSAHVLQGERKYPEVVCSDRIVSASGEASQRL